MATKAPAATALQFKIGTDKLPAQIANVTSQLRLVDKAVGATFPELLERWIKYFNRELGSSVRAVTHTRTGKLSRTMSMVVARRGTAKTPTTLKMTTTDQGVGTYAGVQELGRVQGSTNKKTVVPLASWLRVTGRKYVTPAQIYADFKRKGAVTIPNDIQTVSGPARIVILRNRLRSKAGSKPSKLHYRKEGRNAIERGRRRPALGMYLIYKSVRGVFGPSDQFHKTAVPLRLPAAVHLQGQMTKQMGGANAPHWYLHNMAKTLPKLISSLMRKPPEDIGKRTLTTWANQAVVVMKEKMRGLD